MVTGNTQIKLTIAIPTYNGGGTIAKLLNSIFVQDFDSSRVEVLISDNASTDNVESVVADFKQVNYFKNESNVGADRNIAMCIERAQGTYVWVIGDDDVLANKSLSKALKVIDGNQDLSAIYINFSLYNCSEQRYLKEKWLDIDTDRCFDDPSEFLKHVGIAPNYLSATIHNKNLFLNGGYKEFFGTNWVQFGCLLNYIHLGNTYVIAEPLVINEGESIEGEGNVNGRAIHILCNLKQVVIELSQVHYQKNAINYAAKQVDKMLTRKITSAKRLGLKVDFKTITRLVHYFGGTIKFWLFQLPLLLLPRVFHVMLHSVYKTEKVNKLYWNTKKW
ncbi:glycosyltransferase [Shewanella sp. D64]|uniref:glycosyltransferase family 2 protein n=1 Tax=unclassified Shewanella TaxID=196818 RepID=UPI0022BA2DBF|nr:MULTISPECIES: glycosyltransferase family 2 protein [unclassified Shewanella]MEC4727736.1 glycosyltransferase [Shewanella sp. D64]MEC4737499.1 glycosyltransferase [Shewanella sp. E94]WBJ97309.1 glycosyltransferase [Shewanella sp. MTB7]